MIITLEQAQVAGTFRKKAECKEHGRIFSLVQEASQVNLISPTAKLQCKSCNAIADKLFVNKKGNLVCQACKENASNIEIEAMNQHMREICAE